MRERRWNNYFNSNNSACHSCECFIRDKRTIFAIEKFSHGIFIVFPFPFHFNTHTSTRLFEGFKVKLEIKSAFYEIWDCHRTHLPHHHQLSTYNIRWGSQAEPQNLFTWFCATEPDEFMDSHCDTDSSSLCSCFDWKICVTKYGNFGWNEINDDVFTWIIFSSICDNYSSVRKSLKVSSLSYLSLYRIGSKALHCRF